MRTIALVLSVFTLAACATNQPDSPTEPADSAEFDERARVVAEAWATADPAADWADELRVFDMTVRLPDVELTEAQSAAAAMGYYTMDAEPPSDSPASTVTVPGGDIDVDVLGVDEAFARLALGGEAPADCEEIVEEDPDSDEPDGTSSHTVPCTTLVVTAVDVGHTLRWTNHGLLELPAYLYTVDGVEGTVSQVAIDLPDRPEVPVVEVPEFAQGETIKAAAYIETITDSQLEYTIAVGACDERFKPLVYETDDLIVIAGSAVYNGAEACTDQLLYQPVTAALKQPVGQRIIVDAVTGGMLTAGLAMF